MPRPRTTGRKASDARQVLVRLNAAEFAAVEKAARGLPLGAWARSVLLLAATAAASTGLGRNAWTVAARWGVRFSSLRPTSPSTYPLFPLHIYIHYL